MDQEKIAILRKMWFENSAKSSQGATVKQPPNMKSPKNSSHVQLNDSATPNANSGADVIKITVLSSNNPSRSVATVAIWLFFYYWLSKGSKSAI